MAAEPLNFNNALGEHVPPGPVYPSLSSVEDFGVGGIEFRKAFRAMEGGALKGPNFKLQHPENIQTLSSKSTSHLSEA
jgi:hypothetical protein